MNDAGDVGTATVFLSLDRCPRIVPGKFVKQRKSTEASPLREPARPRRIVELLLAMSGSYMARHAQLF
jgi:hypothetical protein